MYRFPTFMQHIHEQAAASCLDNLRQYRDITNREACCGLPFELSS